MDNDSERMILIGNCGVFIEYKKTRFILDGLYKDTRSFFGDIPEIMKKAMMEGKGYLANADYLFFSHAHGDHYLGEYLLKYVAHNSVKGVLLPELAQTHKNTENYKIIKNKLLNIQHNHISLASDINIVRKKMHHLCSSIFSIPVFSYFFNLGGKKILFLADSDYIAEDFRNFENENIEYIFITPLFFNNSKGRYILFDNLSVKKIIIYHLPDLNRDYYHYYRMVKNDVKKYAPDKQVIIWYEYGQSIML